jgi:acetyltransferase-like isoleucine patch superfamily enzyme
MPGVTIGSGCVIAAGSVVTTDIPDNSIAAGVPAVVKKKIEQ